jgi:hypothetical protein
MLFLFTDLLQRGQQKFRWSTDISQCSWGRIEYPRAEIWCSWKGDTITRKYVMTKSHIGILTCFAYCFGHGKESRALGDWRFCLLADNKTTMDPCHTSGPTSLTNQLREVNTRMPVGPHPPPQPQLKAVTVELCISCLYVGNTYCKFWPLIALDLFSTRCKVACSE